MTVDTRQQLSVIDIDSHEMSPLQEWGGMFGEEFGRFAEMVRPSMTAFGENANNFDRPGLTDSAPLTEDAVWHERGPSAPGAFDLARRLQVLDLMGTERQLLFPSGAITAYGALLGGEFRHLLLSQLEHDEFDPVVVGLIDEYNRWAVRQMATYGARLRVVALLDGATPDELIARAEGLVDAGIRALHLASGIPPGGVSPADHALDPLWRLASDADAAIVTHIAGQGGFVASTVWNHAPELRPGKVESTEVGFDPLTMSTIHQPVANFLSAMVLGGVFERFPQLRFGALELGGYWIGHLAEVLDVWIGRVFRTRSREVLSMKPSEYLNQNVRVSPFYFEDTRSYFERWPHLSNCFAYGSDYPHVEGGVDQRRGFLEQLQPLGEDVVEKFFVRNGDLLVPEL